MRGAPRSKLARSGTLLSRALGFETQGTNGLGMYAVEACLKQYLRDSHLAHRGEPVYWLIRLTVRTSLIIPNPPVASCVREYTAFLDASMALRVP